MRITELRSTCVHTELKISWNCLNNDNNYEDATKAKEGGQGVCVSCVPSLTGSI